MQIGLPVLKEFLEKNSRNKNKTFGFFREEDRILIGYFPKYAFMADRSKYLPEKLYLKLKEKLPTSFFLYKATKLCPLSGKPMKFVVIKSCPEH